MSWLKTRRDELDLSQDDMAARLQIEGVNVTRSAYSAWETGRNKPPLDEPGFRRALARALKLSEGELLNRAGFEASRSKRSEEAEIGADIIDGLPPEKRDLAVRLLEQLQAG